MESSYYVLKRNADFLDLKNNGKRLWATKWLLLNYKKKENPPYKYGVTISRKVATSVTRNRLKRWIREILRELNRSGISLEADVNFIFKPIDEAFYKSIEYAEFKLAVEKGLSLVRKGK